MLERADAAHLPLYYKVSGIFPAQHMMVMSNHLIDMVTRNVLKHHGRMSGIWY